LVSELAEGVCKGRAKRPRRILGAGPHLRVACRGAQRREESLRRLPQLAQRAIDLRGVLFVPCVLIAPAQIAGQVLCVGGESFPGRLAVGFGHPSTSLSSQTTRGRAAVVAANCNQL